MITLSEEVDWNAGSNSPEPTSSVALTDSPETWTAQSSHTFTHYGSFPYYDTVHGADNGDGTFNTKLAGGTINVGLVSITVSPSDYNPQQFTATGTYLGNTYLGNTTQDLTKLASWSLTTSAGTVINFNNGLVPSEPVGSYTITASLGLSGEATLSITSPSPQQTTTPPSIQTPPPVTPPQQTTTPPSTQTTPTTPPPAPAPTPPVFLGAHRIKVGKKKTVEFVLSFNTPLGSGAANYQVTQPGRKASAPPRAIGVASSKLDPTGTTITLVLGNFSTAKPLTLMATGLVGANGAAVAPVSTPL
jgi:hypothetical protein